MPCTHTRETCVWISETQIDGSELKARVSVTDRLRTGWNIQGEAIARRRHGSNGRVSRRPSANAKKKIPRGCWRLPLNPVSVSASLPTPRNAEVATECLLLSGSRAALFIHVTRTWHYSYASHVIFNPSRVVYATNGVERTAHVVWTVPKTVSALRRREVCIQGVNKTVLQSERVRSCTKI